MKVNKIKLIVLIVLICLAPGLPAQNPRTIPLDIYLIIDVSENFREVKDEIVTWINEDLIDRLLQKGDSLVIWSVGDATRMIHSETISSQKDEVMRKIKGLEIQGRRADLSTAIREAASRSAQDAAGRKRFSYILMVSGSIGTLTSVLENGSAGLLRWSRVEKYSRWQALMVTPDIGEKVRQAAAVYMNSR